MQIDKNKLIKYIARMAMLKEEDIDFSVFDVINYISILDEVDISGIDIMNTNLALNIDFLYTDEIRNFSDIDSIIKSAMKIKENCFVSSNPTKLVK